MSLTSFLLGSTDVRGGKGKGLAVDKGLDTIFQSAPSAQRPVPTLAVEQTAALSREDHPNVEKERKKRKHSEVVSQRKLKKPKVRDEHVHDNDGVTPAQTVSRAKPGHHQKPQVSGDASDDEEVSKIATNSVASSSGVEHGPSESDEDSENDVDISKLVHESVLNGGSSKNSKKGKAKAKYVPPEETLEKRNERTIFVGNVPVDTVKNRSLQKQFKRHVLSLVPTAKVESMRFRSVAFATPTAKLAADGEKPGDVGGKGKEKDVRPHDRERTASWRASKSEDAEDKAKQYLTPKEKRRIAFIKHELHEGVDSVNAYVVFAHQPPSDETRAPPAMNPYEAAKLAAERCDGTVFMERTLRVDMVGRGSSESSPLGRMDPKTTIFVGNLDFASKEQDLRVYFEGVVVAERGAPPEHDGEESDEEDEGEEGGNTVDVHKKRAWVKRVRIIRDKDTQLGKGFAYVQFLDRECVDEILAMDQTKLKFAKRKLRVQRCRTLPGSLKVITKPTTAARSLSAKTARPGPVAVPKGDPYLGQKLAHLPKDKRKELKAADADRVARRLAKKKAKVLAEKGVKARPERERERKRPTEKKAAAPEKKKRRVRSGAAVSKLNTKK